jgi:hypothetical protein
MWKEKLLLVQRQTAENIRVWHLVPFSVFFFLLLILWQSCIQCTWIFFSSPLLRGIQLAEVRATTFFFFLHNCNWQVMKLFVKIFAFFKWKKKENQNRATLKNYFIHRFCLVTIWGLKMEKRLRISLFHFILFSLLLFFFALLRS